jgi:RHS repeat-associated protein
MRFGPKISGALAGSICSIGYDALDRLTSATTSAITDGWTYDANGNRLTQTGTNASTFSVSSGSNQLTGVTGALSRTYSYTAAGMVSGDGTNTFTYNNRGRMLSAANTGGTTNYLYSALGQLIQKSASSPTNLYMYDEAGHLLGEYDGSGNLIQETVWLGDIPVATLQPNGSGGVNVFYVHTDHLNTPKKISRPSDNALVWRVDQDPFGTAAPNQNPSGIGTFIYNVRFPGQLYMAETGINQNYFRDYDPQVARYVESDPIGLKAGINTYAYARSNPLLWVDPLGLESCSGGVWNESFGDFSGYVAFGGFASKGAVSYTCSTRPSLKCSANVFCIGGGPILGGGVSWNLWGYATGATDSKDLAGWSGWQTVGNIGPIGLQAPSGGGLGVATGISGGAGIGLVKCYTYAMICSSRNCGRTN